MKRFSTLCSALVCRPPMVMPQPSEISVLYADYAEKKQTLIPFDRHFYFPPGSAAEKRFLNPEPIEIHTIKDEVKESLNRKEASDLYLLVKQDQKWLLPCQKVADNELLHETAKKIVDELGGTSDIWPLGRKPVAHYKRGDDTFFLLKWYILSGNVESKDVAWVTKDEMKEMVDASLYDSINKVL